jgi:hypothetical protein
MARTIYDRPTRALFKDMVTELGMRPGQLVTSARIIEWFQQRYPKLKPATILGHLAIFSTNDRSRLHHALQPGDDLLFKVDTGQFRLYEPGRDPAPSVNWSLETSRVRKRLMPRPLPTKRRASR